MNLGRPCPKGPLPGKSRSRGETNHLINEAYSFKMIFVDEKGIKDPMSKSVKGVVIEITGPSNVKVRLPHCIFSERSPILRFFFLN